MKKFLKKTGAILLIAILGVAILGGCSQDKEVKLAYIDTKESVAITYLAKEVLENKLGYEVSLQENKLEEAYSLVSDRELDGFLASFSKESTNDKVVNLGSIYEGVKEGLFVPSFIEINSIKELNDVIDSLYGEIFGLGAGSQVMNNLDKVIDEYSLDYRVINVNEDTVEYSFNNAIETETGILAVGRKPSSLFSSGKVKLLEDPKGIFGEGEVINAVVSKDLDNEEVVEFFKNLKLNDEEMISLLDKVETSEDIEKAVQTWINDNEETVNSWIK